jgi:small subunit ribosomal protein S16
MAVKIRLHRQGRKKTSYYFIVVADSRSPRDGKFIERIGSYNPMPVIPHVDVDIDKAITWLNKGAQPTKTVRSILSQEGVLFKKHLQRGIKMGMITAEDAEKKFADYLQHKTERVETKLKNIQIKLDKAHKDTISKEAKVSELRAKKIMEKHQQAIRAEKAEDVEVAEDAEASDEATEDIATDTTSDVETPEAEVQAEETEE